MKNSKKRVVQPEKLFFLSCAGFIKTGEKALLTPLNIGFLFLGWVSHCVFG
jgi:hypothetical protein